MSHRSRKDVPLLGTVEDTQHRQLAHKASFSVVCLMLGSFILSALALRGTDSEGGWILIFQSMHNSQHHSFGSASHADLQNTTLARHSYIATYPSAIMTGSVRSALLGSIYTPFSQHRGIQHRFAATAKVTHMTGRAIAQDSVARPRNAPQEVAPSPLVQPAAVRKCYFATCIPGLATTLARELQQIGAHHIELSGTSGVYFESSPDQPYVDIGLKALLWVRTAHRLMELVTSSLDDMYYEQTPVNTKEDLIAFVQRTTPLRRLLRNNQGALLTFSVSITLIGDVPKELCHSHFTALTVKNALVDSIRDMSKDNQRPDIDLEDADVPLHVVLRGRRYGRKGVDVSLYRILHAGGSLHKRGYRSETEVVHKLAMKESLASGLLLEAGWDLLVQAAKADGMPAVLVDPMTGSATFPLEAAMIAADYAPGLMRMSCHEKATRRKAALNPHQIPPVVRWRDANVTQWIKLLGEAKQRAEAGLSWVMGTNKHYPDRRNCDILSHEVNERAATLALSNIKYAEMEDVVSFTEGDCATWELSNEHDLMETKKRSIIPGRTIVVANPPWGMRNNSADIEESWNSLKTFLRRECNGTEAWVLSGDEYLPKLLYMKRSQSVSIKTADADLRWMQFKIFDKKPVPLTLWSRLVVACKGRRFDELSTIELPDNRALAGAIKMAKKKMRITLSKDIKTMDAFMSDVAANPDIARLDSIREVLHCAKLALEESSPKNGVVDPAPN